MFLVGIVARQSRKLGNTGVYHVVLMGNERENIFQDDEE
jgi:REP element-mobilizing transposase RayT